MASLIIEHGAIPQYLPKKTTNYKYIERGKSRTVDYIYTDNLEVIGVTKWGIDESVSSADRLRDTLSSIMIGVPYPDEPVKGVGMGACNYFPYRPHTEIYHSDCIPYYEDGVQIGWQETADTTRTSIVVVDDWNYSGGGDGLLYDRNRDIYTYNEAIIGIKDTATDPYHTVVNSDIQYLDKMSTSDFIVNRTIFDIDGNQIGSALPRTDDREHKRDKTWTFEARDRTARDIQELIENETSMPSIQGNISVQVVTSTNEGTVWAITGADKWFLTMPENTATEISFPSPLPLILVPYTITQNVNLYDLQLTEEIEP